MRVAEHGSVLCAWTKRHRAAWSAIATAVLVSIAVVLAIAARSAFLFVSIGPIIYEYIERPLARASSPRSTIIGNGLALLVGYCTLAVFGLQQHPSTVQEGVTLARACTVITALAATGALLVHFGAVHPPAGSTLLLVTLGIMHRPIQLACIFVTILIVSAAAWMLNRLAGIGVPVWCSPKSASCDERSQ